MAYEPKENIEKRTCLIMACVSSVIRERINNEERMKVICDYYDGKKSCVFESNIAFHSLDIVRGDTVQVLIDPNDYTNYSVLLDRNKEKKISDTSQINNKLPFGVELLPEQYQYLSKKSQWRMFGIYVCDIIGMFIIFAFGINGYISKFAGIIFTIILIIIDRVIKYLIITGDQ